MNQYLIPIQIILISFLLFAFSRAILRLKEGTLSLGAFFFWSGIWLIAIFSVLEPGFSTYLARKIGIGRGADAIVYGSIALLFYLIFRTNVMIENLRQEITELVRQTALQEADKPTSNRKKKPSLK